MNGRVLATQTATTKELPDAVVVMNPFHVVRLAGDALDRCRQPVQQHTRGHRGRKDDALYRARRTLHTGADLLTDKQKQRIQNLFAVDEHVQVETTWGILSLSNGFDLCWGAVAQHGVDTFGVEPVHSFCRGCLDVGGPCQGTSIQGVQCLGHRILIS